MTADEPELVPDEVRSAEEVARRALALNAVVVLGLGVEREKVLGWLSDNGIWNELSPREHGFVDTVTPTRRQIVDAAWQCERLIVLLWALGLLAEIPPAHEQCDTGCLLNVMPPTADIEVGALIRDARLRGDDELFAYQEACLDLHWHARDAKINGTVPRKPVDIGIVQERHHAINWICGYDGGAEWDEVTTDT